MGARRRKSVSPNAAAHHSGYPWAPESVLPFQLVKTTALVPRATQSSEFQPEHFRMLWGFGGFHRGF